MKVLLNEVKKMKIIVIGLGSMGKRRIRLLKTINENFEIIGIDSNEERKEEVSGRMEIPCFSTLEEVDFTEEIACAFVCTAPLSHAKIINNCLHKNLNVFTEINLVQDGYLENIELAKKKNKILFLSSTPIYRDEMQTIKQIIQENNKPVSYIYHVGQYLPDWHPWESFQSFFVNDKRTNGCREIMAIEFPWLLKTFGTVKHVQAISSKLTDLEIDYADNYMIQLLHENGTTGTFMVDVVCRQPVRKLEIYNQDIYIEWSGKPETLKKKNLKSKEFETVGQSDYVRDKKYSEFINECAYINEINEFFEILHGKQPEYEMEDDLYTLALIDEIEGL